MLITLSFFSLLDCQSTFQYQFSSYLINAELKKSMLQLYASKACGIFNSLFSKKEFFSLLVSYEHNKQFMCSFVTLYKFV